VTTIRPIRLLLAMGLALTACSEVKDSSGPPPGGTWQGSAAPPLQTESQRMMMQNAPVTRPTPQPRSTY
jgi:hypothetical protein